MNTIFNGKKGLFIQKWRHERLQFQWEHQCIFTQNKTFDSFGKFEVIFVRKSDFFKSHSWHQTVVKPFFLYVASFVIPSRSNFRVSENCARLQYFDTFMHTYACAEKWNSTYNILSMRKYSFLLENVMEIFAEKNSGYCCSNISQWINLCSSFTKWYESIVKVKKLQKKIVNQEKMFRDLLFYYMYMYILHAFIHPYRQVKMAKTKKRENKHENLMVFFLCCIYIYICVSHKLCVGVCFLCDVLNYGDTLQWLNLSF